MAITLTPEQLANITAIIGGGIQQVRVGDMQVTYAVADLIAMLQDPAAVGVDEPDGAAPKRSYATFSRE